MDASIPRKRWRGQQTIFVIVFFLTAKAYSIYFLILFLNFDCWFFFCEIQKELLSIPRVLTGLQLNDAESHALRFVHTYFVASANHGMDKFEIVFFLGFPRCTSELRRGLVLQVWIIFKLFSNCGRTFEKKKTHLLCQNTRKICFSLTLLESYAINNDCIFSISNYSS